MTVRSPATTRLLALAFAFVGLTLAVVLLHGAPAGAQERAAATEAGLVKIKLDPRMANSLRRTGVSLRATGAASSRARSLRIPVSEGTVGSTAQLANLGGLKLVAAGKGKQRKRVVRLRTLRTVLADGAGYVTARFRGRQVTLLRIGDTGDAPYDPLTGRVALAWSRVAFDEPTAASLADRLGVERLRTRVGVVSIDATVDRAPVEQTEAQVRPRPPSATDIVGGSLTWRARPSWVDYLHAAGAQGGTRTSAGATDGPAEVVPPSSTPRVYQYDFPFASGWYDAASDTANVGFSGTVTYFKLIQPFNIDLDTSNPVVELGGAEPRLLATLNGRGNNSDQQDRTALIVDLDQAAVAPVVTSGPGTTTYTWTSIPGKNPSGSTTWPIAGYYQPGDAWGTVTVSLTVAS